MAVICLGANCQIATVAAQTGGTRLDLQVGSELEIIDGSFKPAGAGAGTSNYATYHELTLTGSGNYGLVAGKYYLPVGKIHAVAGGNCTPTGFLKGTTTATAINLL